LIDLAQRKLDFWSSRRRLNVVERHITRGHFPGEPIFVRRPGATADNDGILLSVVLDGRAGRSYLLALDPPTLESRARAFLPHHVPSGFPAHSRCFEAGDLAGPRVRMSHTNSGSFGQRERHQAGEGPEVRVRLPPPASLLRSPRSRSAASGSPKISRGDPLSRGLDIFRVW
jgi:hypothetical protein